VKQKAHLLGSAITTNDGWWEGERAAKEEEEEEEERSRGVLHEHAERGRVRGRGVEGWREGGRGGDREKEGGRQRATFDKHITDRQRSRLLKMMT
jgi:hypothetical protein